MYFVICDEFFVKIILYINGCLIVCLILIGWFLIRFKFVVIVKLFIKVLLIFDFRRVFVMWKIWEKIVN